MAADMVAEVGGTQYETLQAAFDDVENGDTVRLLKNVTIVPEGPDQDVLYPQMTLDTSITLDLNGYTIGYEIPEESLPFTPVLISVNRGTLTITGDGTIDAECGYNNAYGVDVYGGAVVVENGTYTGALTAIQVTKGTLTILDGTFKQADTVSTAAPEYAKYVINCIDGSFKDGTARIYVKGGTFCFDPADKPEASEITYVADGYVSVADGENYEVVPAVAEADGKYYATLGEAVAAVHEKTGEDRMAGTTIKLLRDASGGGIGAGYKTIEDGTTQGNDPVKFTLDLGGHTYTVSNPTVGSAGTETNGFQLLKDSVVTIQNGAIKTSLTNIIFQNYCNLTLKDVQVEAPDAWCVMSNNCGDVNFIGNTSITGGTGNNQYAFDVCATTNYSSGVTVNIDTTGTITGTIMYDVWTAKPDPNLAKLNIKNGTFVGGFYVEEALVEDAKENFSITGGRFSEKPNDAYLKVTGGAFVQDAQGYWTVGSKSGMEAETTTSGDTANVTVGGTFVPQDNGNNVQDVGNTINITATTTESTSSTEVAISSDAMESVSGTGYDVAIDTDVATVTVSDAAWDQITENAQGQDVTIAVAKEGTDANPVYVLTAEAGGEEVFSSENAGGTITISVKAVAPANQIYYIREDGSLQNMNAQYDEAAGTLTWEVTHFSGYGEGSGKVGLVEGSTVSFYDTVSAAIQAMTGATGTITLLDNVTENITIPTNKTIRLELNGKKITNSTATHTITVDLGGSLTVQDTVGGGVVDNVSHARAAIWNNGTTVLNGGKYDRSKENGIDKEEDGGNSYYVLVNHGEMEINEGVTVAQNGHFSSMIENGYYSYNSGNASSGYAPDTNAQYPSLTINGGSFSGGLNTVKNDDGGKLEINGGNFSNVSQAVILNWNEATISGGTFTVNEENVESVILNGYADSAIDTGKLTITGGTFTSNTDAPVLTTMGIADHSGTIDITGGTLNGDIVLTDPQAGGTLAISQDAVINGDIINQKVADVTVTGGTVTGQVTNSGNGTITVTGGSFPNADVSGFVPDGSYTVIFKSNGGDPIPAQVVAKGTTITLPDCNNAYYYKFAGWQYGSQTYYAGDEVKVNSNMTFEAQWEKRFQSSGSGSSSSSSGDYAITVDAGKHGDVSVSPKRADEGDTVTITVDPDKGYEVDEVIVTDKNGDSIRVRDRGDGEYTFTMPDSKVTVEVTFVEEGDELSFVDVAKSDYYYDAVKWAVDNGVTTGVTDTIFAPGNPCTRAQTVTFLWRAAGMPQAANRVNPFTDVSVNDYYYEAVLWAVENGITGGTTATTFSPNATCTRAQVVTFLWRYSKEDASILPMFTDVAESDYYYGAVAWAVENGVTTGVTDTTFAPGNPCTRGQIVTFLYRYMGK